jgi:hypothetical protein
MTLSMLSETRSRVNVLQPGVKLVVKSTKHLDHPSLMVDR